MQPQRAGRVQTNKFRELTVDKHWIALCAVATALLLGACSSSLGMGPRRPGAPPW